MKQQHASPWAILAVTSLAVFAVMLDALVLFVAFPSIARSFSTVSSAELSWVLNGYTIVYGALLVPAGRLADRVWRKRVFLGGAALLAFGVIQSATWGWGSPWVQGTLFGGALTLLAFVVRCSRVASPALDLTLFRDRTFSLANAGVFFFSIGFTAMFFGAIFFLTRIWGYTLVQAGLAMMPGPLMVVLLAPIAGRLAAVYGHRRVLVPGGILYASGALVLFVGLTTTPHFLTIWLPSALLTGIGVALILPVLGSAAVQNLPPQKLAVGSGVNQAIRQFGTVLGVSLTFAILGDAPSAVPLFHGIYLLMIASGLSVSVLSLGIDTLPK